MLRLLLGCLALLLPLTLVAAPKTPYTILDTAKAQELIRKIPGLTIVDARAAEHYDGRRIKGSIWLPYDATDAQVAAALPKKNAPILSYCWSVRCPASQHLIDRLVGMGYTNLYEYPEGLQVWLEKGLPTTKD